MRAVMVVNLQNDGHALSDVPSVSCRLLMAFSGVRVPEIGRSMVHLNGRDSRWRVTILKNANGS